MHWQVLPYFSAAERLNSWDSKNIAEFSCNQALNVLKSWQNKLHFYFLNKKMDKEIILVGDKVLIEPDDEESRTDSGLYLPQGVKEKEKVQTGKIVKTGPGYPVPDPSVLDQEPWVSSKSKDKYFPLQAKEGDYCIFLRDQGVEIQYNKKKYIVSPHAAILVLIRKNHTVEV